MPTTFDKRKGVSGPRGGVRPGTGSGSSGSSGLGGPGTSRGGLGGSGGTGRVPITSNSWSSSTSTLHNADYFSRGGGSSFTLGGSSPFAGRLAGGGTRDAVVGTRRFGSGYPYSNGNIQRGGLIGQPFPFGFWPIFFIGHGYTNEYGRNSRINGTEQRPGGELVQVKVTPNATQWTLTAEQTANDTALETFYMIGDRESVETMLVVLSPCVGCEQYSCGTVNSSITTWDSSNSSIGVENVVQWYRSSSFELAYAGYNNTYASLPLNESTTLDWENSSPLPSSLDGDTFLQCLNATIAAALPVLNAGSGRFIKGRLSWAIVWAIWSFIALVLLGDVRL